MNYIFNGCCLVLNESVKFRSPMKRTSFSASPRQFSRESKDLVMLRKIIRAIYKK